MAVQYNEKRNSYKAYFNGKSISFSVRKYGAYAKILADLSFKNKKRIENLIVKKPSFSILKIYSETYGYHSVFLDSDNVEKVKDYPWYISPKGNNIYLYNNDIGPIHRFLMTVKNPEEIIDHINKNGLDNRKHNLRVVNKSINARNINIKSNNKTGINGVHIEGTINVCTEIRDLEGNKLRKRFSIKKYGFDKAFELASEQRKDWEEKYGYL